jgi:hypothetical protein
MQPDGVSRSREASGALIERSEPLRLAAHLRETEVGIFVDENGPLL